MKIGQAASRLVCPGVIPQTQIQRLGAVSPSGPQRLDLSIPHPDPWKLHRGLQAPAPLWAKTASQVSAVPSQDTLVSRRMKPGQAARQNVCLVQICGMSILPHGIARNLGPVHLVHRNLMEPWQTGSQSHAQEGSAAAKQRNVARILACNATRRTPTTQLARSLVSEAFTATTLTKRRGRARSWVHGHLVTGCARLSFVGC